ncbi:MAG TPA: hypothetical protein PK679_07400, partial [Methanolinea sp.]|nr:hypothetical protein [Methanolinea sp.]HRU80632.1 hypothetical protein [Methanolinea sp.]
FSSGNNRVPPLKEISGTPVETNVFHVRLKFYKNRFFLTRPSYITLSSGNEGVYIRFKQLTF